MALSVPGIAARTRPLTGTLPYAVRTFLPNTSVGAIARFVVTVKIELILKIDLGSPVSVRRMILIYKAFHFFSKPQQFVQFIAQLTGSQPMDHDHPGQAVRYCQVEVLIEGFKL